MVAEQVDVAFGPAVDTFGGLLFELDLLELACTPLALAMLMLC